MLRSLNALPWLESSLEESGQRIMGVGAIVHEVGAAQTAGRTTASRPPGPAPARWQSLFFEHAHVSADRSDSDFEEAKKKGKEDKKIKKGVCERQKWR